MRVTLLPAMPDGLLNALQAAGWTPPQVAHGLKTTSQPGPEQGPEAYDLPLGEEKPDELSVDALRGTAQIVSAWLAGGARADLDQVEAAIARVGLALREAAT